MLAMLSPVRADENADSVDPLVRRSGKHLRLVTDVDDEPFVDELIASFDAAVPLWEKFWNLPTGTLQDWKVDAYVMKNASRFAARHSWITACPSFVRIFDRQRSMGQRATERVLHASFVAARGRSLTRLRTVWRRWPGVVCGGNRGTLATHRGSAAGIEIGVVPATAVTLRIGAVFTDEPTSKRVSNPVVGNGDEVSGEP